MSKQVQLRKGTTNEHNSFTGALGEVTVDTTTNTLRVHDGVTVGGHVITKNTDIRPISTGGTGATTAAEARTNLGLRNSAVRDVMYNLNDASAGKVMTVGAFGWGQSSSENLGNIGLVKNVFDSQATVAELDAARIVSSNNDGATGYPTGVYFPSGSRGHAIMGAGFNGNLYHYHIDNIKVETGRVTQKSLIRTAANTTVDSNGFLKNASPIVQLFADKIELNDEAQLQEIVFEKLSVGDYLIKNSTGLSNDGWYIEQPKDANGNIYHAVVHEQLESGNISIKTYECKLNEIGQTVADLEKPIDIKENRFITLRLNELPKDTTAPQNPNVVDNEGNPAPSKYHTLENGTWVISEADSEKLAADKHKAYMDSLKPLTRRQFMRVLVLNGFDLDVIETQIQTIEDAQTRQLALIDWKEATEFVRNDETLLMVAGLLGLSEDQINQMWEAAQQH